MVKTINMNTLKKSIMKGHVFLLLMIVSITFMSCSSDDDTSDPEPEVSIDLASHAIEFSVVRTSDFEGVVTIKGMVQNLGDDFVSGEGQQIIYLYERALGLSSDNPGTLLAEEAFTTLDADETIEISFSKAWSASVEFPPDFILVIAYDPDIYIDSNPHNDDSNSENNILSVNGSLINDEF